MYFLSICGLYEFSWGFTAEGPTLKLTFNAASSNKLVSFSCIVVVAGNLRQRFLLTKNVGKTKNVKTRFLNKKRKT